MFVRRVWVVSVLCDLLKEQRSLLDKPIGPRDELRAVKNQVCMYGANPGITMVLRHVQYEVVKIS